MTHPLPPTSYLTFLNLIAGRSLLLLSIGSGLGPGETEVSPLVFYKGKQRVTRNRSHTAEPPATGNLVEGTLVTDWGLSSN